MLIDTVGCKPSHSALYFYANNFVFLRKLFPHSAQMFIFKLIQCVIDFGYRFGALSPSTQLLIIVCVSFMCYFMLEFCMCVLNIICYLIGLIYYLTFDVNKGICSPPWSFKDV